MWVGDLRGAVENEFRVAQRLARGVVERVSDELEERPVPRREARVQTCARRRVVAPQGGTT